MQTGLLHPLLPFGLLNFLFCFGSITVHAVFCNFFVANSFHLLGVIFNFQGLLRQKTRKTRRNPLLPQKEVRLTDTRLLKWRSRAVS